MVIISGIAPGGIADSLGLQVGDRIVSVDSMPVRDFLDVLIAERLCDVELVVERVDGELWHLDIEKEANVPFGLALEHPEPAHCGNNCLFCFVHQLPKGMRRTLYVKDEDFRFSYLYGAYITLSNLNDAEIDRIIQQKLSPLYISVHAVNPELRSQLLGRPVTPILPVLQRLVANGIELHTQVVVCPGLNDREALAETVEALTALAPGICSLALVPVGLTAHRQKLQALKPVSKDDARAVLSALQVWQENCLDTLGNRFVFAADEFYLRAGFEIPALTEYEDLAQIENGVGKIALFRSEAEDVYADAENLQCPVEFTVVTGKAFHGELSQFLDKLSDLMGSQAHLYAIDNKLFGDMVTVAGLIGGNDIIEQLKGKNLGSALLIPDVMMRDGDDCFLDDMTPADLEKSLGCQVVVVEDTPWGILDAVEELAQS